MTAWDISTAVYDSKSFFVGGEDESPNAIYVRADGLKMYMVGEATDNVRQYTLSTAWDVSTASFDSVSFNVNAQAGSPRGLDFRSDGLKMYIVGGTNDTIYQYTLSTAWDVSTASYDSVSLSISGQTTSGRQLRFKSDGLRFFLVGTGSEDAVFQYSLGTLWDLSTASYDSVSLSVSSQDSIPIGLFVRADGFKMYITTIMYSYCNARFIVCNL